MRNKDYRRSTEAKAFKRRKVLVNSIKDWKLNDEQVKVTKDQAVNWMSNEYWYVPYKKRLSRKLRHNKKIEILKLFENEQ